VRGRCLLGWGVACGREATTPCSGFWSQLSESKAVRSHRRSWRCWRLDRHAAPLLLRSARRKQAWVVGLALAPQQRREQAAGRRSREGARNHKAKASARPFPPAPCRFGRSCAVFHFLLLAVDLITAARTHVLPQCFVSDRTLTTPSYRPYRIATMPVILQVIPPAL
jgi:hypothetical protein